MKLDLQFSLFILIIVFASCTPEIIVRVETDYESGVDVEKLNLVSTMIGPVWQPDIPLIDAAAFNKKTNDIADQIMDAEQRLIQEYQNVLIEKLSVNFPNTELLIGKNIDTPMAQRYKVNKGVNVDHKNFPIVFFSEGDMNLVDFEKAKNMNKMYKKSEELKSNIRRFCSDLELDHILLSYNRLSVIAVGPFGGTGSLRLECYLYLFDKNGELLIESFAFSIPTNIKGKELSEYKFQLDNFDELTTVLTNSLKPYIK